MQLILLEKIQKLGDIGEIKNVKSGYARNFLIPQGKAKIATKENIAELEKIKTQLLAKQEKELKNAQAIQKSMQGVICNIKTNATEDGKLFGSISVLEIIDNLKSQGFEIEKRNVHIPEAIRQIGEYTILVSLYADIEVEIKILIEAIKDSK